MGHIRQLSKQRGVPNTFLTVPMPRDMLKSKGVLQRIKIKVHVLLSVRFLISLYFYRFYFFSIEKVKPQKIKTSKSFLLFLNVMKREDFGKSAVCNLLGTMVYTK